MSINFVGKLQEKFQSIGIQPKYSLVTVSGAAHDPFFRFQVKLGDHETVGSGRSKKAAKNSAAEAMLTRLNEDSLSVKKCSPSLENKVQAEDDEVVSAEDIDALSTLCKDRGFRQPQFVEQLGSKLSERVIIFSCQVGNVKKIGEGETMVKAKNTAAGKVLDVLRSLTIDPISALIDLCDEQGFRAPEFRVCPSDLRSSVTSDLRVEVECLLGHLKSSVTGNDVSSAKDAAASKMIDILNSMRGRLNKSSSDESIESKTSLTIGDSSYASVSEVPVIVNDDEFSSSFVNTLNITETKEESKYSSLDELCKKNNISLTSAELKMDEYVACFVQVNTVPVVVGFCMNDDPKTMKKNAERDVLNYLNMLTNIK